MLRPTQRIVAGWIIAMGALVIVGAVVWGLLPQYRGDNSCGTALWESLESTTCSDLLDRVRLNVAAVAGLGVVLGLGGLAILVSRREVGG